MVKLCVLNFIEFGFINPVLIDSEYGIIAGHGRVLGAKKLGMDINGDWDSRIALSIIDEYKDLYPFQKLLKRSPVLRKLDVSLILIVLQA